MRSVLVLVLVAACGDAVIDRDVCGNGIVEPGEDCDSIDPRCESCGITCASTQECLDYDAAGGTAGFVCGPDLFCHAPTGEFELVGEVIAPVNSFRVTDVDGDGVGDILSQSQTAVSVVFGDETGTSLTTASILTPTAQGQATYGDLDTDGRLDVLMPTADGIVAYTSPFGQPSPFPFPSLVGEDQGKPLFVSPLDQGTIGIIGTLPGTDMLVYLVLDVGAQTEPGMIGALDLCGAATADFSNDNVSVFEVSPNHQIIAVRLRPPGQSARLCLLSVDLVTAAPKAYSVKRITFTPTAPPGSRPVLADLRDTGCPSLVVAQGAAVVEYAPVVSSACGFLPGARTLVLPPNSLPIGQAPLVPAIGSLNRFGIAFTTGVYGFNPLNQQLVEVYHSQRTLANIRAADIDDDGDVDLIATGDRDVAIDILYRIPPFPGFQPFLFNTDSTVLEFQIGDFDGNDKLDIAYVESRTFDERLLIAYGTADQLLPGALVGTFGHVLSTIVSTLPDSTDTFNRISDLAVLFEAEPGSPTSALTLLHGSPQRTMLAFFDPRDPPPEPQSTYRGVVTGRFGGADGNDIVAIETAAPVGGPTKRTTLWLTLGAMGGDLQSNQTAAVATEMVECTPGATDTPDQAFCLNGAHYVAWPASPTEDLVLGIDGRREIIAFEPATFTGTGNATIMKYPDRLVGADETIVRNVHVIRLADGTPRLVIGLGPDKGVKDPRLTAAVNVCTFDLASGPKCVDIGAAIAAFEGSKVACVDAAYAQVAAASRFEAPDRTTADLLVLCRREVGPDALYRVAIDTPVPEVTPLLELGGADALQVGDVTGDGIDDVIVVDRNFAVPLMRVYRQCNSRDIDCGSFNVVVGDPP